VHTVVMVTGRIYIGQIVEKTPKELVLREVTNVKEYRLPLAEVEETLPQKTSLMPEGMLRDLTAHEAAELLKYLESLTRRRITPQQGMATPCAQCPGRPLILPHCAPVHGG